MKGLVSIEPSTSPAILSGVAPLKDTLHLFDIVNLLDCLVIPNSLDAGKPEGKAAFVTLTSVDGIEGHLEDNLWSDDVDWAISLDR